MRKPVLVLDFDDCLIPTDVPLREWITREKGIDLVSVKRVPGKFMYEEAFPDSGLTATIATSLVDEYIATASINTLPFEKVIETLEELHRHFELHVVTARPDIHHDVTLKSVEKHFKPGLITDVHSVGGSGHTKHTTKEQKYRELHAVATVDDGDHNVNTAIEAGLLAFSLQHPTHEHNGMALHADAIVITDFSEMLDYIDRILQHEVRS